MSTSYTPGKGTGDSNDENRNPDEGRHTAGDSGTGSSGDRTAGDDTRTQAFDRPGSDDARTRAIDRQDTEDTQTRTFDRRDVSAHQANDGDRIQGERHVDRPHRLDPDADEHGRTTGYGAAAAGSGVVDHDSNLAREKEAYGGMKFGSAFFGWLAATGMTVLLAALAAVIAGAIGLATNTGASQVVQDPQAAGIWGIVILLLILFIAYYCGGYVAGRMARFSGAKQGLGVWLWAIIVAVILTVIGAIAGTQFGALSNFNGVPQVPMDQGIMTTTGILTLVGLVLVTLGGAILGGLAGMRYHRKVDRAGFDPEYDRRPERG